MNWSHLLSIKWLYHHFKYLDSNAIFNFYKQRIYFPVSQSLGTQTQKKRLVNAHKSKYENLEGAAKESKTEN